MSLPGLNAQSHHLQGLLTVLCTPARQEEAGGCHLVLSHFHPGPSPLFTAAWHTDQPFVTKGLRWEEKWAQGYVHTLNPGTFDPAGFQGKRKLRRQMELGLLTS